MPVNRLVATILVFACCTSARVGADDGTKPSVPDLVNSLRHADPARRATAAAELGRQGASGPEVTAALRAALGDANRAVRARAAVALWRGDRPPVKDVLPGLLAARDDADEA